MIRSLLPLRYVVSSKQRTQDKPRLLKADLQILAWGMTAANLNTIVSGRMTYCPLPVATEFASVIGHSS